MCIMNSYLYVPVSMYVLMTLDSNDEYTRNDVIFLDGRFPFGLHIPVCCCVSPRGGNGDPYLSRVSPR